MIDIYLVEDDEELSSLIKQYLEQHDFDVNIVPDGGLATEAILNGQPKIVILDLMLPGKDGLSICRELRPQYQGGILILTASEDDMDHVAGIEIGADDYIIKPIKPRVLLARIRMLVRHLEDKTDATVVERSTLVPAESTRELKYGLLAISSTRRAVVLDNKDIALTTSEFDLLWLLANHAEQILSRDFIYTTLRGTEYDGMDRAIDTLVANLRKKLGDSASLSTRIVTVRGQGYLFVPDNWH